MYTDAFDELRARAARMDTPEFRAEHQTRWSRHLQDTINALVNEIVTEQDVKAMLAQQPLIPGGSEMLLWSRDAPKYGAPMADGEYRTVCPHSTRMVCLGPPGTRAQTDAWFRARGVVSLREQLGAIFAPFQIKIRTARNRVEILLAWSV
jgi:hypothetical protein